MIRKVKKKKSGICIFVTLLLMFIIIIFAYKPIMISGKQDIYEEEYNDLITTVPQSKIEFGTSDSIFSSSNKLNSTNAILISLKDDTILMQENSEEKIFPASMTKIMTAIVAIENLSDLNEEIELTHYTFNGLYSANASMAGFQAGEKAKAIDLLYGVLLPSGAEACIGLADEIAGSEKDFERMMNQKVAELGMDNTHFENTTGLHDENHYTTVKDMSILLSYSLKNDTFREIFTSSHHSTQPTNKHPGGMTLFSTMFEKLPNKNINDGEILGGKTGYTDEAGLCLASLARVDNQEYVLVTAGAKGSQYSEQFNITDAIAVYSSIGKK